MVISKSLNFLELFWATHLTRPSRNIDYREFLLTMSAIGNSTLEDTIEVAFRSFDLNNDGTISRGKFKSGSTFLTHNNTCLEELRAVAVTQTNCASTLACTSALSRSHKLCWILKTPRTAITKLTRCSMPSMSTRTAASPNKSSCRAVLLTLRSRSSCLNCFWFRCLKSCSDLSNGTTKHKILYYCTITRDSCVI